MKREDFLEDMEEWNNHRLLLWEALKATKGKVVEFGSGAGSTPFLRKQCKTYNRAFESYDHSEKWSKVNGSKQVSNWDDVNLKNAKVLFIDHAPAERRWVDIKKYANKVDIIVIHDTEPESTGYMMDKIWHLFKYRVDVKSEGAWATAVSNTIDLKGFKGKKFGKYKID